MKVILNVDVPNLGEEGDVCEVKPGYARNYLLPRGMVLLDNSQNRAVIDGRKAEIERRRKQKLEAAQSQRERIEGSPLTIEMPAGENGRLFGSVTAAGIVERLGRNGITVEKKNVDIPEKTIKSVGNYKVMVRLYGEEEASLMVQVVASGKGASESGAGKAKASAAPAQEASAAEPESSVDAGANADAGAGEQTDVHSEAPETTALGEEQTPADEQVDDSQNPVS